MRILMLHNYYQLPGGEDVSFASEAQLLEDNGCEVTRFEENNLRVKTLGPVRSAFKAIWSQETYREIRYLLRRSQYDVMHVQNFFPLISPSAYYAARAEGVAVVQSLRNYRLICPASTLSREGQICEDCLGKTVAWPGIRHACYQNSTAATSVVAAMLSTHHTIGTWKHLVDVYIALTQFGRRKFIKAGLPSDKILVKPNLTVAQAPVGDGGGGYALFVGRLEHVKGVESLLSAWERLGHRIPLKITGIGPMEPKVQSCAETNPGIEYLGQCANAEVLELLRNAAFAIVPSVWYEGFSRVIVEAYSVGTPVVASDLGSMAEVVDDARNGLLFKPGDADDLTSKVGWLVDHPEELHKMREQAHLTYQTKYSSQENFDQLMEIYETAITRVRRRMSASHSKKYDKIF